MPLKVKDIERATSTQWL